MKIYKNRVKFKNLNNHNRLILVFYVGVDGMTDQDKDDIKRQINNIRIEKYRLYEIFTFYTIGNDIRLECLNPKLVSKEEYNKTKYFLDKYQTLINSGKIEIVIDNE